MLAQKTITWPFTVVYPNQWARLNCPRWKNPPIYHYPLPGYSRQRIKTGLPAQDLNHAHEILVDLETALIPEAPPVSPGAQPDDTDIPLAENGVSASASIAGATAGAMGGNP